VTWEGVPEVADYHPKHDTSGYLNQQLLGPKWDEDTATPVPLLLLNIQSRHGCELRMGGKISDLGGTREWHGRSLRVAVLASRVGWPVMFEV
jgi:hypothetical protein